MPSPLQGLRIVEAGGWNVAFAGRLLADAGADVVRVVPAAGDWLEREPPFIGETGVSIQAAWYNAGKRIVATDADNATRALVMAADILIDDWLDEPQWLSEVEGGGAALARVSVTPFGRWGPWSRLPMNDLAANAFSGPASVTGDAHTPPVNGWGNQAAHTVGLYAAICGLAARRAAKATGHMQHVDLSGHEALTSCTEQLVMQWFFPTGGSWPSAVAPRQGSLHWSGAYKVVPDRNGTGLMVTAALRLMEDVLPWLEEEGAAQDLADREKYPDVIALVRAFPHVVEVMEDWVRERDAEELFYEAQRRRLSYGPVWDVPKALESPQIAARAFIQEVDVEGAGKAPLPGRLFRTSAEEGHIQGAQRAEASDISWGERAERPTGEAMPSAKPLAGIRVLDFTHVLAGPFGTRVLGDLGADVIKVSSASRAGGANSPAHPYYVCWNRNKRSVMVNMALPEGKALCRRLALASDVIVENFAAGVLARWGLDRAALAAEHPGVTVISMGGMGQTGPWKDFVTFAPTIHALTGLTYLTNPPGEHLLGYGFSLTDHLSGLAAALAALEGLEHRERTGQGLAVDLSQYELGLATMAPTLIDYLVNGTRHEPVGSRDPWGAWAPHGIYRCAGEDRWVAIAARGDDQFRALTAAMARPELARDERFGTHEARLRNQDDLDAAIEAWTRPLDRYEVLAVLSQAGIVCAPVQDAEDLATVDPQHAARGFYTSVVAPGWGEHGLDHFPAFFNGERPEYEPVHELGVDTFDVLVEVLGMGDDEVAELMAGAVLS